MALVKVNLTVDIVALDDSLLDFLRFYLYTFEVEVATLIPKYCLVLEIESDDVLKG